MDHPSRKLIVGLLAVTLVLTTFGLGFAIGRGEANIPSEGALTRLSEGSVDGAGVDVIEEAYRTILESAIDPPTEEELTRAAIKAMVKLLRTTEEDPYALFYSPEAYEGFEELSTGKFQGVGLWLKPGDNGFEVVSVLPSSPALDAGMLKGDIIAEVDGVPVDAEGTLDAVVNKIKGPEGTEVRLTVKRGSETLDFEMTRATLELPNVRARLMGEVGYVQLFGFGRGAGSQLRDKVDMLVDKGAKGIALDLRANGGGLFDEGVDVASVFIEDGEIVSFEDANESVSYDATGDAFEDLPLVVLVDGGTASASEIVAGALQDSERAQIVGTLTFGKGSVQNVVPLGDSSALKLTTGTYLTPSGREINGVGIMPDVVVEDLDVEAPDLQRVRAFELLRDLFS